MTVGKALGLVRGATSTMEPELVVDATKARPRLACAGIGRTDAGAIWCRALTVNVTSTTQYADAHSMDGGQRQLTHPGGRGWGQERELGLHPRPSPPTDAKKSIPLVAPARPLVAPRPPRVAQLLTSTALTPS